MLDALSDWLAKRGTRQRKARRAKAARRSKTSLNVESMEERALMTANYFVLDYTPDYHQGSFVDTFVNARTPQGYAPAFLDFNGDRTVNAKDAEIAAGQITAKVQSIFAPFSNVAANNLKFVSGDVTKNTNLGYQWLNYGSYYPSVEVAVIYIGGTDRATPEGAAGRAPQAAPGTNIEGYGNVYSRITANIFSKSPYATKANFVNTVATDIAHELGHMMGLGHTAATDNYNIMNGKVVDTVKYSYSFVNATIRTENGTYQNAYMELNNSFRGNQRQVLDTSINNYGQAAPVVTIEAPNPSGNSLDSIFATYPTSHKLKPTHAA